MEAREALDRLIVALEYHYEVSGDPEVIQEETLEGAEDLLRDAFFTYDDTLFTNYGVELPFEMLDDEYDEDFDEAEDEEEDDILFEDEDEDHDR